MFGYIYKIRNKINDKIYVGQKISKEYVPDYYGSGIVIKKAVEKYGKDNFEISILDIAYSLDELNKKEESYIRELNSLVDYGNYNIALGGGGIVTNNKKYLYIDYNKFLNVCINNKLSNTTMSRILYLMCFTKRSKDGKRYLMTKNNKYMENTHIKNTLNFNHIRTVRGFKSNMIKRNVIFKDEKGLYVPENHFAFTMTNKVEETLNGNIYCIDIDLIEFIYKNTKIEYNCLFCFLMLAPFISFKNIFPYCKEYLISGIEVSQELFDNYQSIIYAENKVSTTAIHRMFKTSQEYLSRAIKEINNAVQNLENLRPLL